MTRYVRIIILLAIIVFLVVFGYIKLNKNTVIDEDKLNENMKFELRDDVYYLNKDYKEDVYSTEYRDIISKKINELKNKEDTLLIYNAYGTNDLSVNLYLKDSKVNYISYTISVDDDNIDDFTNNLSSKESQIIGLVPGYVNNIKIILFDKNNHTISKTNYEVDLTGVKKISSRLDIYGGKDIYISDGLFTVLSKDNIYMYDNKGIVRSHIILDDYTPKDILFKDNYMYYPINKNNIVKVDNLGQIKDIYSTEYDITNDYVLDNNKILFIGTDKKKDTIKDQIISINLNNHDVTKLVDCTELFSKDKENSNNYFNFVSMDYIDGDILLSSKATSSIIRINDIYKKPYIKYILGNNKLWDEEYYKYIYEYKDDLFFGQSEIDINGDTLTILNNNYVSKTNYDKNKSIYDELKVQNTDKKTGTKSLFYKLKINDKKKNYKLVESYVLPYTSTNGSLQKYKGNYIFNSNINNTFIEYNNKFEIINSYKTNINTNKVYKYSYKKYWFK